MQKYKFQKTKARLKGKICFLNLPQNMIGFSMGSFVADFLQIKIKRSPNICLSVDIFNFHFQ